MTLRRRRVLVHLNSLELGGTQINAVDFAAALAPLGFDSCLIGPRPTLPGPSVLDVARDRGVDIDPYEEPETVLAHARLLSRWADRLDVDLVHAYGTWGAARSVFWGPSRFASRPWVLTMYEMVLSESVHRHVPLVVGTEYLLDECVDRPGPTILIRPPVDMTRDRPSEVPVANRELTVVIVSRLEENLKAVAIESAIGAVRLLADRGIVLKVVGTGAAAPRLRLLGQSVNAEVGREAVQFVGPMSDPRAAYAGADIVLGMGGSAARALAHGKPLVAQGDNGWSEIFEPETAQQLARNSYWSDEKVSRPDELLARQLTRLIDDPALRVELGRFGRIFAERHFGLEAMAARLATFYEEAIAAYTAGSWWADLPTEARRVPAKVARVLRRA
ncbi:MAG: hypothetical protein BGO37_08955 [Cellulomonas sp. 73-92]|uniref:glycosyltransferase family 4 protein n=1 Tax=Cellulomonas sp. 73-92 TaxID=1895740 RepID=UPI000927C490|nr:glycosyltransferase family 4 protein [Cellulomonas sp. 73-92]OJV83396.1 MAG: hypothetical protein BGO37_08955 [Cellulomonas sp. 73-92]